MCLALHSSFSLSRSFHSHQFFSSVIISKYLNQQHNRLYLWSQQSSPTRSLWEIIAMVKRFSVRRRWSIRKQSSTLPWDHRLAWAFLPKLRHNKVIKCFTEGMTARVHENEIKCFTEGMTARVHENESSMISMRTMVTISSAFCRSVDVHILSQQVKDENKRWCQSRGQSAWLPCVRFSGILRWTPYLVRVALDFREYSDALY